jgi:hypothetical protein
VEQRTVTTEMTILYADACTRSKVITYAFLDSTKGVHGAIYDWNKGWSTMQ